MKTYMLAAILSLGSYSAYSSTTFLVQGHSQGLGDSVACEYESSFEQFQIEAEKQADLNAFKKCQEIMGSKSVSVERLSDFEDELNCRYQGPWYSTSVLTVDTQAYYVCR